MFVQHQQCQFHQLSKRTQEDAGEERVTAKSKPMMNLVSRYSVRDPNVLVSIASENTGKTKSERVPLSSLNVQQTRTGRPELGASSSNYSEWNVDDKWSSQEWKSDEMLGARTSVDKNPPRRSRKISCLVTRTSSTQQERGDRCMDQNPSKVACRCLQN